MNDLAATISTIQDTVNAVIVDQRQAVRDSLLAMACGGHILIEDLPGMGKTTLARALAQVFGFGFQRVQGTTDKLPAEITGSSVWDQRTGSFRFVPGPLFAQCVLIDEINRLSPKSQSALLEAMEEGQVTVDTETHALPRPFTVIATQNPIDLEGTFPLLEPALDRFFVQLHLGYPDRQYETRLHQTWQPAAWRMSATDQQSTVRPVADADTLFAIRQAASRVEVSNDAEIYLMDLIERTRTHEDITLGLSPRAGLMLRQAAQAQALLFGNRSYVIPDDIKGVLLAVGAHRIRLRTSAAMHRRTAQSVLVSIMESTSVAGSYTTLAGGR